MHLLRSDSKEWFVCSERVKNFFCGGRVRLDRGQPPLLFGQHIFAGYRLVTAVKFIWHLIAGLWMLWRQKHSGWLQTKVYPAVEQDLSELTFTAASRAELVQESIEHRRPEVRGSSQYTVGTGHQRTGASTCCAGSEL